MKKVAFIIPPTVELLELAGPVQVFTEAKFYGFEVELEFFIYKEGPVSSCGLGFGKLPSFLKAKLKEGDYIIIPGMDQNISEVVHSEQRENSSTGLKNAVTAR